MANERTIVLYLKSKDEPLREAFGRFREAAAQSVDKSISFEERVRTLERMRAWGEKAKARIAALARSGVKVGRFPEPFLETIPDAGLRLRLAKGLFANADGAEWLERGVRHLPERAADDIARLAAGLADEEYVLFWNMGELEADDLLPH